MGRVIKDWGGEGCVRIARPRRVDRPLSPEIQEQLQEALSRVDELRSLASTAIKGVEQSDELLGLEMSEPTEHFDTEPPIPISDELSSP